MMKGLNYTRQLSHQTYKTLSRKLTPKSLSTLTGSHQRVAGLNCLQSDMVVQPVERTTIPGNSSKNGANWYSDSRTSVYTPSRSQKAFSTSCNKGTGSSFTVGQYNVLASYLGQNTLPWFLYGVDIDKVTDKGTTRRKQIFQRFHSSGNHARGLNGYGWPFYVDGILSKEEMEVVEEIDKNIFPWKKRKWRILDEINRLDCDVLSMVEVDHHEDFFRGEMSAIGYDSVYRKRPRPTSKDGCGIYWKRDEFELGFHEAIDFIDSVDTQTMRRKTDRTCLCTLLYRIGTREPLVFVSVHLARNPENPEQDKLRGKQMAEMVFFITSFTERHNARDAPVIVCGDVNATNYNKLRGIASTAAVFGDKHVHPFIFEFQDVPSGSTSVTTTRQIRVDAILFQKTHLELVDMELVPMLSPSNPIPNDIHPSDHLPMKAKFRTKSALQRCLFAASEWWAVVSGTGFSLGPPLNHEELSHAFTIFDYTGKNLVDAYSLRQALQLMRISSTPDQCRGVLSPANGSMNYAQFCLRYLCDVQFIGDSDRNAAIHEAFNVVDANHDRVVTKEELLTYFEIFEGTELQVTMEEIDRALEVTDIGAEGIRGLSYGRFCYLFMVKYTQLFFPPEVAVLVVDELTTQFQQREGPADVDLFSWGSSKNLRLAAKLDTTKASQVSQDNEAYKRRKSKL